MTSRTRFSLVGGPLCLFGYGVLRLAGRTHDPYGPGPWWLAAHLAAIAGTVLFGPAVLGLRRLLPSGPVRESVVVLTLLGLAASAVQFAVDVVSALGAADHAALSARTAAFQALPGADVVVYQAGPPLFYLGLVVLAGMLAAAGRLRWWQAALVLAGSVLPVVSLDLLPVAAAGLLAGLWLPSAGTAPVPAAQDPMASSRSR